MTKPASIFVRGSGFDPSSFYGEDGEEEEEEEEGNTASPFTQAGPVHFQISNPVVSTSQEAVSRALSTSQLLDLFGGSSDLQQPQESNTTAAASTSTPKEGSSAEPVTDDFELPEADDSSVESAEDN